jgi:hypothetical protein
MITRKVGLNRGKRRLWLEGAVLANSGFARGTEWILSVVGETMLIDAIPEGNRKVAGTEDRPIIDINSERIFTELGWHNGDEVHVFCSSFGHLVISMFKRGNK